MSRLRQWLVRADHSHSRPLQESHRTGARPASKSGDSPRHVCERAHLEYRTKGHLLDLRPNSTHHHSQTPVPSAGSVHESSAHQTVRLRPPSLSKGSLHGSAEEHEHSPAGGRPRSTTPDGENKLVIV